MKKTLCAMAALAGAAAWPLRSATATDPAATAATRPGASVIWKLLAPGAERGISGDAPDRLQMFRFELDRYRVEVEVGGHRPARGRVWMPGARHTAAELLHGDRSGQVVAVVNGGFFDDRGHPLGLRMIDGVAVVPFRDRVDWGVFVVADRRARIVHSSDFAAISNIEAAVQVGPRILIAGVVPRLKPQVARRTALAIDRDGKTVTLVVADDPIDATVLGNRLASLGFDSALLLDGGPSTQMAVAVGGDRKAARRGEVSGQTPDALEIAGGYPVPDLLAIVRR